MELVQRDTGSSETRVPVPCGEARDLPQTEEHTQPWEGGFHLRLHV